MRRPLQSPGAKPRRRVFPGALGRAASAGSWVLSRSLLPEELQVCDQMRDVSRSLSGISKFPSPTRPILAGVHRDCHAACGQANSSPLLETGAVLEGARL